MTRRQIRIGVLVVLGSVFVVVLISATCVRIVSPNRRAVFHATQLTLERVRDAIELHKTVKGCLPQSLDALPGTDLAGNRGDIPAGDVFRDAWGKRLQYLNKTNSYQLRSAGPDGSLGTRDDIVLDM